MNRLGEKLKELRQLNNMSLSDVAERIGKTKSFIWDLEKGNRLPSEDTIKDLANVFQTSIKRLKDLKSDSQLWK